MEMFFRLTLVFTLFQLKHLQTNLFDFNENNQEKTQNKEENIKTDNKDGSFSKLKNFVSKAVNCCRE